MLKQIDAEITATQAELQALAATTGHAKEIATHRLAAWLSAMKCKRDCLALQLKKRAATAIAGDCA